MFNCGIYKITNILNGKMYIGSSKEIKERKSSHFRNLKNGKHHSIYLQNAYDKYGKENFLFEPVIDCLEKELKVYEDYYIGYYQPVYNMCKLSSRYTMTDELWLKLSNRNKGRIVSDETRKKLSEAHKGHVNSKESYEKGTATRRARGMTEKELAWRFGKIPNDETRKKMSLAKLGTTPANVIKCQIYDKLKNITYIANSYREMSELIGLNRVTISAIMNKTEELGLVARERYLGMFL